MKGHTLDPEKGTRSRFVFFAFFFQCIGHLYRNADSQICIKSANFKLASFSYTGLVGRKKKLEPNNRAGFMFLIL